MGQNQSVDDARAPVGGTSLSQHQSDLDVITSDSRASELVSEIVEDAGGVGAAGARASMAVAPTTASTTPKKPATWIYYNEDARVLRPDPTVAELRQLGFAYRTPLQGEDDCTQLLEDGLIEIIELQTKRIKQGGRGGGPGGAAGAAAGAGHGDGNGSGDTSYFEPSHMGAAARLAGMCMWHCAFARSLALRSNATLIVLMCLLACSITRCLTHNAAKRRRALSARKSRAASIKELVEQQQQQQQQLRESAATAMLEHAGVASPPRLSSSSSVSSSSSSSEYSPRRNRAMSEPRPSIDAQLARAFTPPATANNNNDDAASPGGSDGAPSASSSRRSIATTTVTASRTDSTIDAEEEEYQSFIRAKEQALGFSLATPAKTLTVSPSRFASNIERSPYSLHTGASADAFFIHKHFQADDVRFARRLYGYVNEDDDYQDDTLGAPLPEPADQVLDQLSELRSPPPRKASMSFDGSAFSASLERPTDQESDDDLDDLDDLDDGADGESDSRNDDSRLEGWLAKQAITKKVGVRRSSRSSPSLGALLLLTFNVHHNIFGSNGDRPLLWLVA